MTDNESFESTRGKKRPDLGLRLRNMSFTPDPDESLPGFDDDYTLATGGHVATIIIPDLTEDLFEIITGHSRAWWIARDAEKKARFQR